MKKFIFLGSKINPENYDRKYIIYRSAGIGKKTAKKFHTKSDKNSILLRGSVDIFHSPLFY